MKLPTWSPLSSIIILSEFLLVKYYDASDDDYNVNMMEDSDDDYDDQDDVDDVINKLQ